MLSSPVTLARILPAMTTTELTGDALEVLRVISATEDQHRAPTVQSTAIGAGLSYMETYDLINQLFAQGLLAQDLRLTEAGRKALS